MKIIHIWIDSDFKENEHPRAANGEFGKGGNKSGEKHGHTVTARSEDPKDQPIADHVQGSISRLADEFPAVKSVLKGLKIDIHAPKKNKKGTALGMYTPGKGGATLEIRPDPKQALTGHYSLGGWDVDPSVEGTIRHELGHAIESQIGDGLKFSPPRVDKEGRNAFNAYWANSAPRREGGYPDWVAIRKIKAKEVSDYAASDPGETFAECFCAYTHPDYGKEGHPKLPKPVENFLSSLLSGKFNSK